MQATGELARLAGDNAMRFFGSALEIESKKDGSPVTEADLNFAAAGTVQSVTATVGETLWGTLVAVMAGESVLAGAAFFPAIGEIIVAGAGEGCWWNSKRCYVSEVAELTEATVLSSDIRFDSGEVRYQAGWRTLTEKAAVLRTWGDCYGYLLVATGRAEVMLDPALSVWDIAPFVCIIPEAGGVLTDLAGTVTAFGGSAIATNAALADAARATLGVNQRSSR